MYLRWVPLCSSLKSFDTHSRWHLCTVRHMYPNPQTNKTKEIGATDCLNAPGPECYDGSLFAKESQQSLLDSSSGTSAHPPPIPPNGGWELAGAASVYGMLSVPKDGQLTVFKFSFGPAVNLLTPRENLCCMRHAHTCLHMCTGARIDLN